MLSALVALRDSYGTYPEKPTKHKAVRAQIMHAIVALI
jgi:hypothetical protein